MDDPVTKLDLFIFISIAVGIFLGCRLIVWVSK